MPCCRRVFKPTLYLTINSELSVFGRIKKMLYEVYNNDSLVFSSRKSVSVVEFTYIFEHTRANRISCGVNPP